MRIISPLPQIVGAALLLFTSACSTGEPEAETQAVSVKLQTLEQATVIDSSEFVGTLEAQKRVAIAPRVAGRIVDIAVAEGDRVARGQLLVQLQLEREQAQVTARVSDINAQRAALKNAEAQLSTAEAERVSAAAEVELQNEEFGRTRFLVAQGALSQQQLDQVRRDREAASAALNAAQRRIEAARATVEQEKAALSEAQAQKTVSEQELQYNRVVAPINGTVGEITPKPGDYVNAGDEIATLTQNDVLNLNINIPIEDAPKLRVGLPVNIINPQGEVDATGQISFISPTVNQSQTVLAKASFSNDGRLRDEQFVKATLIWNQEPGVLVPTTSISRIGGESFVFVAQQTSAQEPSDEATTQTDSSETSAQLVAQQKVVKLGDIQGQSYQVISGVEAGDRVVVSGILNLSDGTPITEEAITSEN